MPKRLPEEKVDDLKQALTGSTSTYDIAKEIGVHESTVSRYSRRLFSNRKGFDDADHYWKRPSDLLQHHDLDFAINHGASKMIPWGCIISEGPGYAC
ncbi:hypothetical protein RO3G_07135 [Rhizopus delemar RA 99-880]|uniref:Uncharacterized protein n=1 Tax=Rhizopus delemar (strain RA 99-880 / ATCC MYA-4621 / FGSC 9543 / NRRL 43880) TaxID=246409 RepID=I1C1V0_RHIO9|nr:hypothetical protein RO3G_07135 [Rhizopus delemar RA 99-880]|eukprot:EIE82430.1 hypothetical protein RO3G_07135 [Rhizopus delemar RA 99-880]